jgi:hypothetical protein
MTNKPTTLVEWAQWDKERQEADHCVTIRINLDNSPELEEAVVLEQIEALLDDHHADYTWQDSTEHIDLAHDLVLRLVEATANRWDRWAASYTRRLSAIWDRVQP